MQGELKGWFIGVTAETRAKIGSQKLGQNWLAEFDPCNFYPCISTPLPIRVKHHASLVYLHSTRVPGLSLSGKIITEIDPDRSKFGFLPLMAGCCDGQIGALNAESFAERVISGSDLVMTNGNTLLGDKMLEMLVVLQMDWGFMEFMWGEYAEEIMKTQPFNMTVIAEGE